MMTFDFGLEDNALLALIGGSIICDDAAPTESRLGQVEVDNQIAHLIAQEEHDKVTEKQSEPMNIDLVGVPPPDTVEIGTEKDSTVEGELAEPTQDTGGSLKSTIDETEVNKGGARPKTMSMEKNPEIVDKLGSRGDFKSQLHRLRRGRPKDRAYKCQVCGKSKHSMEDLNFHHRQKHDPQKCGVCGKVFDLATSRVHHMYSHYARKYQCDKCSFHCFFNSELEAHKFVHREGPSFKCMYPKCGRWFKRKGELSLHVEVHKSTWYDCKKCDFSTKLIKYLKEHEKSHIKKNEVMPYECSICGERFMWRSGVKRHKEKKH